jgi:hypothetical protein
VEGAIIPNRTAVMTSTGRRRAELDAMRHPSREDWRVAVPPALVCDIDRILLDHGLDLPKADIKAALAWLLSGSYGDAIGGPPSL